MRHALMLCSPDPDSEATTPPQTPTIRPSGPGISGPRPTISPAAGKDLPAEPPPPKIQVFEQRMGGRKHEEAWARSPNVTGTGAIHVKSFHCKLNDDSLVFLDQQINEWLDAHPQYEVKFVTTSVGEWQGKMREPQMIVQVWV
jgi:hypothetical protein